MKIVRSSKCTIKFANDSKKETLKEIRLEYGRVVNLFIDQFWIKSTDKRDLLKPVVDSVLPTWLSFVMRQIAAREAIDMISSSKERDKEEAIKPLHHGKTVRFSSSTADLQISKDTTEYDAWIHISSIGKKIVMDIPIRFHKHFNKLLSKGTRLNSYVIGENYVQFSFKIITGPKKKPNKMVGMDTGINTLAALSTGELLGTEIKEKIKRIYRCQNGSKGHKTAIRSLHQYIDETANNIVSKADLIVLERLKNITKDTTDPKRDLNRNRRRAIGSWNASYFHNRIKNGCESKNVSWRSVPAYYTSQTCSKCGNIDKANRHGSVFKCQQCGHTDNADINAAINILNRFAIGIYGPNHNKLFLGEDHALPKA